MPWWGVEQLFGLKSPSRAHLKCSMQLHEHALVELAPFLTSRELYLSMPPLYNLQYVRTELQWHLSHASRIN